MDRLESAAFSDQTGELLRTHLGETLGHQLTGWVQHFDRRSLLKGPFDLDDPDRQQRFGSLHQCRDGAIVDRE